MKFQTIYYCLSLLFAMSFSVLKSQDIQAKHDTIRLDLETAIQLAKDSSIASFRMKNMYLANYWAFKNYKANKLPSLNMYTNLADYNRSMVKRYDSENDVDIYRLQQLFSSGANLSLTQRIPSTGGSLYFDSEINMLNSIGNDNSSMFYSVPARIGLSQPLFSYNSYKWESKIAPVQFEKSKLELVYNLEEISIITISHFFNLVLAQVNYNLSKSNLDNADTLYKIALKKYEIAAISQEELLGLKLNLINTRIKHSKNKISLRNAEMILCSFLKLSANTYIIPILPESPPVSHIPASEVLSHAKSNNPKYLEFELKSLESSREVDKNKMHNKFNTTLNISYGLNQSAVSLSEAYDSPMGQQIAQISFNFPIVDWKMSRGKYEMAMKYKEVAEAEIRQDKVDFERNIMLNTMEYNNQASIIAGAIEADKAAEQIYRITQDRFVIGEVDLFRLNAAQISKNQAKQNYYQSLQNYWIQFYKIRQFSLYDFSKEKSLLDLIDFELQER